MKPLHIAALFVLTLILVPPRAPAAAEPGVAPRPVVLDRDRIALHLARVERHLRSVDVSHLTPAQRRARGAALDHLREYRLRGEFPHNHDFAERTPFFVDERGVHCAMAYLIARSGDEDLVARVAATANNAYIRDLAADPELQAWLERNGMTVAEAALVQPTYGGTPPEDEDPSLTGAVRERYAVFGAATLVADVVALQVIRTGQRRGGGLAAVLVGTAGSAFAASVLARGSDAPREALAVANLAAGATTVGFGIHSLLAAAREDGRPTALGSAGPVLEVGPAVIPGSGGRPGVGASLRF